MAATVDIGTLITSRPEIHGGRPCLAGTGMTVLAIVGLYKQGIPAEEILRDHFDHLDLARIYAALAYWAANREEIDGYFREDAEAEAEWIAEIEARESQAATA